MNLEQDLNGKDQRQPGAKLDAGKNRLGLVLGGFSRALQAVGRVGTFGATKYTDNGWMSVERGQERYTDAMLRHMFKELEGEVTDPESGIEHAAHTAWNALARLELMLRERLISEATKAASQHVSVQAKDDLRQDIDKAEWYRNWLISEATKAVSQHVSVQAIGCGEIKWPESVDINGHIQQCGKTINLDQT